MITDKTPELANKNPEQRAGSHTGLHQRQLGHGSLAKAPAVTGGSQSQMEQGCPQQHVLEGQ